MVKTLSLDSMPDEMLLARLSALVHDSRRTEADLLRHIGEVDARRLYLRRACSSMFRYCTGVLHLSEAEAYLRITAARAARQHPPLPAMVTDGRLHLTAIAALAPHLTTENRDAVLARATHLSKERLLRLVAELSPRPDVPDSMRRLPGRSPEAAARSIAAAVAESQGRALAAVGEAGAAVGEAGAAVGEAGAAVPHVGPAVGEARGVAITAGGGSSQDAEGAIVRAGTSDPARETRARQDPELCLERVGRPASSSVEPLAPGRYKVQFTASAALRDKLERLQTLLSREGDASLAAVIEAAVDEKLKRVEASRLGRTSGARRKPAVRATGAQLADRPTGGPRAGEPRTGGPRTGGPRTEGPRTGEPRTDGPPTGEPRTEGAPTGRRFSVDTGLPAGCLPIPLRAASDRAATRVVSRTLPAATKRAVWLRDQGQCRFVSPDGRRCMERRWLEFHHTQPLAVGGEHEVNGVKLLCRPHHRYVTELDFGTVRRRGHRRPARPEVRGAAETPASTSP
jgi:5-methylcytosine-specific restriction endonuclease McrA